MRKKMSFKYACCFIALISSILSAQATVNIAVVTLKNNAGVTESDADLISDRLRAKLFETGKVGVMEREQMQEILKEQGLQNSGACNDEACLVQIGKLLGVQRLVTGTIGKIGVMFMANIRMVDVQTGKIVKVVTKDINGQVEDVVSYIGIIAADIVSDVPQSTPVTNASAQRNAQQPTAKIRMAIMPFAFNAAAPDWLTDKESVGQGITDKLNVAIAELGRFEVVERVRLNDVMQEQALAQSGVVSDSAAAQAGNVTGAELIVTGAINMFSVGPEQSDNKTIYRSRISMSVRFVDATTTLVKKAAQIETDQTGSSASDAQFKAMSNASKQIIDQIKLLYPLKCSIAKIEGKTVYLTMGSAMGIKVGMQFKTWQRTTVTDNAGKVLGTEQKETGIIKVTYADSNFAKAQVIKDQGIRAADEVEEAPARTRVGIGGGFSYFGINGTRNTVSPSIAYHRFLSADTSVQTDFSGYSASSAMIGGFAMLEFVEISNTPFTTQFVFDFLMSNGDLHGFVFDWNVQYDLRVAPDRFWIPVGLGLSYGRLRYDYQWVDELLSNKKNSYVDWDAYEITKDELSAATFGGFAFAGVRLRIVDHVDIFAQGGYRIHPPINGWEIEYKTGQQDSNGKDKTDTYAVTDKTYLPFKDVMPMGVDVRAGVSFTF